MSLLTADEVDQQLEKLRGGASSPEALGDWARDMRMEREPESEAVGEVLARMQQLGRADHLPEDLSVLREALRSRDAVTLLHRHFTGRTERGPELEAAQRVRGRKRIDALRGRNSARDVAWWTLLVLWALGYFPFSKYLDNPDDLVGWDLFLALGYFMAMPIAGLGLHLLLRKGRTPKCPSCGAAWEVDTEGGYTDLIRLRRCPKCRARF